MTTEGPALEAAGAALAEGGSAVDAGLIAALLQVVVSGGSWVSLAGVMAMVCRDGKSGTIECLNAAYNTVASETDPLSIPGPGKPSGRSVLVPGFIAGLVAAHHRFGKLPFKRLFQPAIDLAENGFVIGQPLAALLRMREKVLRRLPEARRVFTTSQGTIYRQGDCFKQPELAETLRSLAQSGEAFMCKGRWAEELVAIVRREGGKLTLEDLAAYRVQWNTCLSTEFGGHQVYAPPAPALGGLYLIEALNLVDEAGLASQGRYWDNAVSLYWLIQITRARYLISDYSDESRSRRDTARLLWRRVQAEGGLSYLDGIMVQLGDQHSDSVVIADGDGNIVSLCHTSNTVAWGTTGIFVGGVSIPDSACFQQEEIKEAGPGKRLPDLMNPVIATGENGTTLAASCMGTSLHELMVQQLVNILGYGMSVDDSFRVPHFLKPEWSRWVSLLDRRGPWNSPGRALLGFLTRLALLAKPVFRSCLNGRVTVVREDFRWDLLAQLRKLGQTVNVIQENPEKGRHWVGIQGPAQGSDF